MQIRGKKTLLFFNSISCIWNKTDPVQRLRNSEKHSLYQAFGNADLH